MNEILFLSLEHKIHTSELTSNVLFITYRHTDDGVYDDFPKFQTTFRRFSITVLKHDETQRGQSGSTSKECGVGSPAFLTYFLCSAVRD